MTRGTAATALCLAAACVPRGAEPAATATPVAITDDRATPTATDATGTPALAERVVDHYRGGFWPLSIGFALPPGVELHRQGEGYVWSSPEEHAAMAVFSGTLGRDDLTDAAAADIPQAIAQMAIAAVGGEPSHLADRRGLPAVEPAVGFEWRVGAGPTSGWIAVFVRDRRAGADQPQHPIAADVFFVIVVGQAGSRLGFDGEGVAKIRASLRVERVRSGTR